MEPDMVITVYFKQKGRHPQTFTAPISSGTSPNGLAIKAADGRFWNIPWGSMSHYIIDNLPEDDD